MTPRQRKCRTRPGAVRAAEVSVQPAANVIEAAARFTAPRPRRSVVTASVIEADFRAARWTPEKLRRIVGPSLKRLPFVSKKAGSSRAGVKRYWNDAPTGDGRADFKRGKKHAALTVEAMTGDGCAWYLERIIEAIVLDAVARKAKGGRYSRSLPPAVDGFIHELSRRICATITGVQRES
jgi:hypothetical protein